MTSQSETSRPIRAVYFDVGETLINESTEYGTWADWLGVPRHTFSSVFGQVIASGQDYREVFQQLKPGSTWRWNGNDARKPGLPSTSTGATCTPMSVSALPF